jgi:hypothetical protein
MSRVRRHLALNQGSGTIGVERTPRRSKVARLSLSASGSPTDRDFPRLLLEQPRLQRSVLNALTAHLAVDTT